MCDFYLPVNAVDELQVKGVIESEGKGRGKKYRLATITNNYFYQLEGDEDDEYQVWLDIKKDYDFLLEEEKNNIYNIFQHGLTEIVNNVFDHSGASELTVVTNVTAKYSELIVYDNGIGIFKKIKQDFGLDNIRYSILELSKGKLTSDEKRHSGEGIFFTSKMYDIFYIFSDELYFNHDIAYKKDYLHDVEDGLFGNGGTIVVMRICNDSDRTSEEVFNEFAGPEDFAFSKTCIPVRLMQIDNDQLISRSQAKRLCSRFDKFKEVVLDFENVEMIGQAFADQIFRVFHDEHPDISIDISGANEAIINMITRVNTE